MKMRTWLILGLVEKGFIVDMREEFSQRYLEGSRLNVGNRIDGAMRGKSEGETERGREERGEKPGGAKDQEVKKETRTRRVYGQNGWFV